MVVRLRGQRLHARQRHRGNRVEDPQEFRVGARLESWRNRLQVPGPVKRGHRGRHHLPGAIIGEDDRLPGESLDVVERAERVLPLGDRVAAQAVEPEPRPGVLKGELVVVERHAIEELGPEPAVLRASRVLVHDGPVAGGGQLGVGQPRVTSRRRRILLLDDHRAVGDRPLTPARQPPHVRRRVVDPDRGMRSVVHALDERSRVAHALVDTPAELPVLASLEEGQEPLLVLYELRRRDGARQGQGALLHSQAVLAAADGGMARPAGGGQQELLGFSGRAADSQTAGDDEHPGQHRGRVSTPARCPTDVVSLHAARC